MDGLILNLLGPYEGSLDQEPLNRFRTNRVQALLIYLAAKNALGTPTHRREGLLDLLWPGLPQRSAYQNLRTTIYRLKKAVPDFSPGEEKEPVPFLLVDRQTVSLNPEFPLSVDLTRFQKLLRGQPQQWAAAVDLYRGDFLADFSLPDAFTFEEWAQVRRAAFRQQALDAMASLATHFNDHGFPEKAIPFARRLMELESLREDGYRQLMIALAATGRQTEAVALYGELHTLLQTELNMPPDGETTAFYDAIHAGKSQNGRLPGSKSRSFELQEQIGAGSFGSVYRALQPTVGRDVAIKVILPKYANDPDFIRHFEQEAQTIAQLEHPHIVPLYDYWREPDNAYLVMRYLRGGSLQSSLQKGPWTPEPALKLIKQISAALYAAHERGIIHRDVKPGNILLDEAGNAYLSDFGIAQNLQSDNLAALDERILTSISSISPEQIRSQPLTPASDIYCLGVFLYELFAGRPPFPDDSLAELVYKHAHEPLPPLQEIRPDLSPGLDEVIARATAKDPAERYPSALALAAALEEALHGAERTPASGQKIEKIDVHNPYKWLAPFTPSDAHLFFGREKLVDQLVARFQDDGRFLAVIGPSGSGKSSLVRAGLIPSLRENGVDGSADWFIVNMIPGTHPFEELELALQRVAVRLYPGLLEEMKQDPRGILRAIRRSLPDDKTPLLLFIDQFEELFTLVDSEEQTREFLDGLQTALDDPHSPLRVVITIRADFLDKVLLIPGFSDLVRTQHEIVTTMSPEELARAIRSPAEVAGVAVEPALVTWLITDVHSQPGALPLLQYTLSELFERREKQQLTLDEYREFGGLSHALGRRAEEIFTGLNREEGAAARQLFLRLITLGEGVEDTRRRVRQKELIALTLGKKTSLYSQESMETAIQSFGGGRLLSFDHDPFDREPTVEVAHEALIREWPRLAGWLADAREDIRLQRELATVTRQWQDNQQQDSYLLYGSRLGVFENWMAESSVALTETEQAFFKKSISARDARHRAEEERQQRELTTARELAQEQTRRAEEQSTAARTLRQRALYLAGALVLAVVFAVAAFGFGRAATENADEALANFERAATSEAEALENASLAVTREAEAAAEREAAQLEARIRATAETQADLQRVAALASERSALEAYSLSLAASARQALEADDSDLALLLALAANNIDNPPEAAWQTLLDAAYAPGTRREFRFDDGLPQHIHPLPDGQLALIGMSSGEIHRVDLESGEILTTLTGHGNSIVSIDLSPNGQQVLTGDSEGGVILWDLAAGEILHRLTGHSESVEGVAFLPDGRRAVSGDNGGSVPGELIVWDLESGQALGSFGDNVKDHQEGIRTLALIDNGRTALVGLGSFDLNNTSTIMAWDLEEGVIAWRLASPGNTPIRTLTISPDERYAVLGTSDNTIYILDLSTREIVRDLRGHTGFVQAIDFSPDGLTLISGSWDQSIIWWDFETGRILSRFTGHLDDVVDVKFLNEKQILSSSVDGSVRLWDLQSNWELARWSISSSGEPAAVTALTFDPEGDFLLVGTSSREIIQIDYITGKQRYLTRNAGAEIFGLDISDNGRLVAAALGSGELSYWSVQSGNLLGTLSGHNGAIWHVDLSADGEHALTASVDGQVIHWHLRSGRPVSRMIGHMLGSGAGFVHYLPGEQMAVSGAEGGLILWDITSGTQIKRLIGVEGGAGSHFEPGQPSGIMSIAVSTDGRQLLTGGYDETILLWDTMTGQSIRRYGEANGFPDQIAFTPDEGTMLSTGQDYTLVLWDMDRSRPLRQYSVLDRHMDGAGTQLAVSPDGLTAVTVQWDRPIIKWRLSDPDPEAFLAWLSANRHLRELTCIERDTYQIEPLCEEETAAATTDDLLAEVAGRADTIQPRALGNPPSEPPAPVALPIPTRESRKASLGKNRGEIQRQDFDVWTFEAKVGDTFSIEMAADRPLHAHAPLPISEQFDAGVLDAFIFLIGPDGQMILPAHNTVSEEENELTDAKIDLFVAPADGTYRIEARSYLDSTAGAYTLIVEESQQFTVDEAILEEYTGHYLEGPWEFDGHVTLREGSLYILFEQTGKEYRLIPISETEFVFAEDGSLAVFTRNAEGEVDGFDELLSTIHPDHGGKWYRAIKLDD